MTLITDRLIGTCVYWPPAAIPFDDFGQPSYGDPVEVDCRWSEMAKEFLDSRGMVLVSSSVVYVETDVTIGGVLFNGELTDVTDLTVPKNNEDAHEIMQFHKKPDFTGEEFSRTAFL